MHIYSVVEGQADDLLGEAGGCRDVVGIGGGEGAVGGEGGDERVEVSAAEDVGFAELEVKLVAGHAILFGVDKHGEIAVVVSHPGDVVEHSDAGYVMQCLTVGLGYVSACLNGLVDLPQIEQSVGRAHLVHLAVDAGGDDLGLAGKSEVLQIVDAPLCLLVVHDERTPLNGVVDLGGVERQGRHVALGKQAFAVNLDAKGMGGVIYDAQPVFVGYLFDGLGVTWTAVAVHRHDGRGARRDGGLDFCRVDVACLGVDIDKHGFYPVPPQRVCCRHKTIGSGDYLACDAQCL